MNALRDRNLSLTPDIVEWYLGKWAEWMLAASDQRGYGKGILSKSGQSTFEQLCAQVDVVSARKVDACIQDLSGAEQAAVSHAFLQAVWRFNREPFEVVYARAVARLGRMFVEKGLT